MKILKKLLTVLFFSLSFYSMKAQTFVPSFCQIRYQDEALTCYPEVCMLHIDSLTYCFLVKNETIYKFFYTASYVIQDDFSKDIYMTDGSCLTLINEDNIDYALFDFKTHNLHSSDAIIFLWIYDERKN